MTGPIDRVTDASYVADLATADLDAVREKRRECQAIENALSYVRRLLHGRLDIVRGELDRRRQGAEPADLEAIVARLPEVLAEGSRSEALPRPPQDLAPDGFAEQMVADLDDRFPASALGSLPDLSLEELAELADGLAEHERQISAGRAALHEVIDRLHEEIVRRYQTGDASVDSLLT